MKGYYVLVCSASWALGRVGKHNFNPLGAAQSTALSSGQWIIYLIVDKPKMSGSQHLLINHSLQGSGGNHGRHLNHWRAMFCTSNRSVSWWTAEWDCSLCAIPQHIFTSTITYWVCTNCIPTGKSASSHTIFLISCKACRLRTDDSNTVVQNAVLKVTLIKKKMEGEKAAFTEMHWWTLNRQTDAWRNLNNCINTWDVELSWAQYIESVFFWALTFSPTWIEWKWYKCAWDKQNKSEWNNYKIASDICTDSTIGLRRKYKHTCLYIVQKLRSGSCPQHCTVTLSPSKEVNWREKAKRSFRHSVL